MDGLISQERENGGPEENVEGQGVNNHSISFGEGFQKKLPSLCQELFYRYCLDFSEESFDRFYRSTFQVFLSFAGERCAAMSCDLDPNEIVNRLYGILVAHATNPKKRLPIRALLSWCFGAINNLIKEERRFRYREAQAGHSLDHFVEMRSPLDQMILCEEKERKKILYDEILKLITVQNSFLTERERKIMKMFYCDGLSLRRIAIIWELKVKHVAVILFRTRRRIALLLRRKGLGDCSAPTLRA
jgi:RNA polymerase sigma factor (sigma-70 family)